MEKEQRNFTLKEFQGGASGKVRTGEEKHILKDVRSWEGLFSEKVIKAELFY